MLRDDTFDFKHRGLNRNIHINCVGFGKNVLILLLECLSGEFQKWKSGIKIDLSRYFYSYVSVMKRLFSYSRVSTNNLESVTENLIEKVVFALLR